MNDDNKNNNNHDDSFDNEDHFGHNEFEDDKYFREEERRKQENFEKYFGDVFNGAELEKGDERRYLEGNRKKNFFNSEEAKKMARILAEFGKEGYSAYYDFMMDQVYWLDEESSRKALRRMEAIREDIRQMETRYLKFKSYWFELDGNIIQLKEEVRSGRMKAEEADREAQALQAQQDKIKDDITRMFAEFEGMEKEYHQFLDIVKTSLKEAIATSKEIREFREQSRDQHGSTLKHYYEMSNFKTGMLENTSGIFGKIISKQTLGIILGLNLILTAGLGIIIGKTVFGDNILPYRLQPDYLVTSKPQQVRHLTSDAEIQKLDDLYHQGKIHFRDISLLKKGKYLIIGKDGLHIAKDTETTKLTPLSQNQKKIKRLGDYTFIPTHLRERTPQYLDHIETQEELRSLRKVADEVANPQDIKLGCYITKTSQKQEGKFKYNVKENGLEGKLKVINLRDLKSQD